MSNKSGVSDQVISLPKGGGALKGLGEKFSPDLHTGTGNFTVPIALPSGRNGYQPELSLVYSTGNGNGPFGLGWGLSIPGVSRQTSKGVPVYDDSKDTFVLSGAEDLIPVPGGPQGATGYRPRTEGLFARIHHYRDADDNYWEVRSKDGLVSFYGSPGTAGGDPATVADPENRTKVFAWKLSRTVDPFGNRIEYEYDEYERDLGEDEFHHWDQLYLKRIRYADYTDQDETKYLVSITFEYENRPDPFSEHRAGFEIRTRKRCKRIEVRTRAGEERLVRTYELFYLDRRVQDAEEQLGKLEELLRADPANDELSARRAAVAAELRKLRATLPHNGASLLSQIQVIGHGQDRSEELPPLEFGYTRFEPEKRDFVPLRGADLPARSLANPDTELVDLFGNGLPDVFETNGTVRYWRNLGDGKFDRPREMRDAPAGLRLADPGVQMIDADGNGRPDLLVTTDGLSGYYPLRFGGSWDRRSFQRFEVAPSFSLEDPEVKLVDLDGDGVTDVVRSGSRLECFFNDADGRHRGWTSEKTRWVERRAVEDFPNVNFSDPRVKWADMTGDGLQDVVLMHDGNVEYWPNLGHGEWGRRVSMRNCPRFPYGHDPKRILVGDVDGDGAADIVYVDDTEVTLWINKSGNGWSDPIEIRGTPSVSDTDAVRLADMMGTGVGGVLWSADAGGQSRDSMFFLDFTDGTKPYLLDEMDNHMGAVTRVGYAPSTRFYLDDQKPPETRWKTPLPFPVQVVSRVEAIDEISGGKLTTEYKYHHGYWDGAEREFRGFGMVEQFDTEGFDRYNKPGLHGVSAGFAKVEKPGRFSPPTLTKTWFHQGPIGDEFGEWKEGDDFDSGFWKESRLAGPDSPQPRMLSRPQAMTNFLNQLPRRVKRDAFRALRGRVLRTELYALDGDEEREHLPYTVEEHLHGVCEVVAKNGQHELICEPRPGDSPAIAGDDLPPRIFFPHALAQRTSRWERGNDPMTQLGFTEDHDEYGQPRKQTQIACPRGWRSSEDTPGKAYLATRSRTVYARPADPSVYIMDRVAETTTYEIENDGTQSVLDLRDTPDDSDSLKVIGQILNFYDGDAFQGLQFGQLGEYGALARTENLVLTEDVLHEAYKSGDTVQAPPEEPPYLAPGGSPAWSAEYPQEFRNRLPALAGYTYHPGGTEYQRGYFAATERRRYDFHDDPEGKGRGLVKVRRDPLGHEVTIAYDEPYHLLPKEITDPAGLKTTANYDYRVFQPGEVADPNGNHTRFSFTPLGLLKDTWVLGKPMNNEGDQNRPSVGMEYDFMAFADRKQPIYVRAIRRVHHDTETDVPLPQRDETITTVEYSDGFGRLIQTRTQAEDVVFGEDPTFGNEVLLADQTDPGGDAVGRPVADPAQKPRVVVSGWQTYDNKGRVVEKYEPFFSEGWGYAPPTDAQLGQKATMFYDPRGQVIRTVNPDGSEQRVIHGVPADLGNPDVFVSTPWEAYTYDANDNAGRTPLADPNAKQYEHHHNTPTSTVVDALGRTVQIVERNGTNPATDWYVTRSEYDIRGNLLTVTDPLGRPAFQHVYDLADRALRTEQLDAGLRRVVVDAAGNTIEQRDSKGALVLSAFDALNRPIRLWARDEREGSMSLRELLTYGDGGTPNQPPAEREANRSANRLGKPYQHYDEAGRLTFDKYDFKGNVSEKVRQVINDDSILAVFTPLPPDWQVKAFRVDWQPPDGTTLAAHADKLLDGIGYRTSLTYDALNRAKAIRYPQAVDGVRKTLRPRYNRAGALERVELDGETYVERIAYNAKGQRTLIAYGNDVMTRYAYEDETFRLLRMRTERYAKPEGADSTYRLAVPDSPLQDFVYSYDLAGNILSIVDRTPGCGVQGNPDAFLFPSIDETLRQRLIEGDALVRRFEYDPLYRLLSATGRECTNIPKPRAWTDDPRCGFNSGTHGTPNQDNAPKLTAIYLERYAYDPAGNMVSLGHQNNGNPWTRHFGMGGLTPQQWGQEWPKHLGGREGWTNPPGNRLTHVGDDNTSIAQTHFYDANGNLIQENTSRHFEWDHADRMRVYRTQIGGSEPSVHAHYLYDSGGQRVKKLVRKSGQVEVTVYVDGLFEHHQVVKGGTTQENNTLHVMDDQSRIALVRVGNQLQGDTTPAVKYHLGDHLGSSNVVIDDDGNSINREEYTPYGETSFGSFARKRYRFTGKERDEESGLYYHGTRYYMPWLGRWANSDPAGAVDGLNLYVYVTNNPLRMVDPNGTQGRQATEPLPGKDKEALHGSHHKSVESQPPSHFLEGTYKELGRDAQSNLSSVLSSVPEVILRQVFQRSDTPPLSEGKQRAPSVFPHIFEKLPEEYPKALKAFDEFQRNKYFYPYFQKIRAAALGATLQTDRYGKVLSLSFTEESFVKQLTEKAATTFFEEAYRDKGFEFLFGEGFVKILGIAEEFNDIAERAENVRLANLPSTAGERQKKVLSLVMDLMASDLAKGNKAKAVKIKHWLGHQYHRNQNIYWEYERYLQLDEQLARPNQYQGPTIRKR